jgi:hypothetical protein
MTITVYVTADHVSPNYCFRNHPVRVRQNHDGTWFADAAKLGCSKDYGVWDDAVFALFRDHACRNIRIEQTPVLS